MSTKSKTKKTNANRRAKATLARHVIDPLWMKDISGPLGSKSKTDLQKVAAVLQCSDKGNKPVLLARVESAAADLIDSYNKNFKKESNKFKTVNIETFNRFARLNDSDYVVSDATRAVMQSEDATFKDMMRSSLKRDDKLATLFEMNRSESDRFNALCDDIYKQKLEHSISEVKSNRSLDVIVEIDMVRQSRIPIPPVIPNSNNQQKRAIIPKKSDNTDNDNDTDMKETEFADINGDKIYKHSLEYKYVRKFANLVLLSADPSQSKDIPAIIVTNKFATQKCNNNTLSMFSSVKKSGKATLELVLIVIMGILGLVNTIYGKSDLKAAIKEINGEMDEDDNDEQEQSEEVADTKPKGGHSAYYIQKLLPHKVYECLETEGEKDEFVSDLKFWNLNIATYISMIAPDDTEALEKAVEYDLMKEVVVHTNKSKKVNSKQARLDRLARMRNKN